MSRRRKQPLILNAENGNALAAGFRASIESGGAGGATGGTGSTQIYHLPWVKTTATSRNRCYTLLNSGLITPAGHSAASSKPASGFPRL